jgi:hypothetical protein
MIRSTIFASFLCATLAVSSCRESPAPAPVKSAPASREVAAKPPVPAPPPPPAAAAPALHRGWALTVKAGELAREAQTVSLLLPAAPPVNYAQVRESKGLRVPTEMQGDGQLAFKIKAMKAGEQAVYLVAEEEAPAESKKSGKGGVLATPDRDGVIKLTMDGKLVLTYQTKRQADKDIAPEYARNGYIHSLVSPGGVVVTDDYPRDKPYQHGVWSGWQKVEFGDSHPDFWDPGLKKGRVSMESTGPLWSGLLRGGFGAHHYYTDMDRHVGATALREGWFVTTAPVSGRSSYTVVDLSSRLEASREPVTLGENSFGGITFRGNRAWQGASHSTFLTSEGQDRTSGRTARWCYLGGKSGGKQAGVVILSHPTNPMAPEAVYVDAEDPVMGFAPSKNGPLVVQSGRAVKLQYRFVVLDGKPDSKLFDRLWKDFANPPVIEVRLLDSK